MSEQSETFLRFAAKWAAAQDAGLMASAEVYRDALVAKLLHGYTTGDFTKGKAAASVKIRAARQGRDGNREVIVGTNDFKQRIWEFGAFNAFTRQYERKEYWRETSIEQGPAMAQAFHHEFNRVLNA